ncbi:hypothetical protein NQ317_007484 [Molorchus minor]|uniref:Uncharacterized protein n=1 Tax=Molorchus minor TaxID=1323400 RepID=A0ABQ9K2D1_9CUCU|nr:hypothetical protein NQ317_007484 [Molorchus minor]
MKTFLVVICIVICIKANLIPEENLDEKWVTFKLKHGKKYDTLEEEQSHGNNSVPEEFDWRNKEAVTRVKDQEDCGSCWAFSAVGTLESHYFLRTGHLVELSEQNLVDCSTEEGNGGCNGGYSSAAFYYVYLNDGIAGEKSYPYEAVDQVCQYKDSENVTSIKYFAKVEKGNEEYLKAAVATVGPVSVAIDADDGFALYDSGIFYSGCCSSDPNKANHEVVVVGYGATEKGTDYWIVKNSWGGDWGEKGYIRMARNKGNNCGVASDANFPLIAKQDDLVDIKGEISAAVCYFYSRHRQKHEGFAVLCGHLNISLPKPMQQFKILNRHGDASQKNFIESYNAVLEHNSLYDQGIVAFSMKINEYSDMSSEEFKKTMNGYKKNTKFLKDSNIQIKNFVPDETAEVPDEFDWRGERRRYSHKKSGTVWILLGVQYFAHIQLTGALEGQYFLKTGKLISISEQNLVDCSHEHNNIGCNGGDMNPSFTYVHDNDGIDSESIYPYEAQDGSCRYLSSGNVTSTMGYSTIENGNEEYLKAAIATVGPIAVGIDASVSSFRQYASGVYYEEACNDGSVDPENALDHAVLAIGYGTEDGQDYWLIKNSWGTTWGDEGYIKMARNRNNNCGVAAEASFPLNY